MTRVMEKMPVALLAPAMLLAAAYMALVNLAHLPWALVAILPYIPYALALVGAIIGWRFKRSRLTFSLAVVALVHWLVDASVGGRFAAQTAQALYLSYSILLPINIAAFALMRERSLISPRGALRAGIIVALFAVIGVLAGRGGWFDQGIFALASTHPLGGLLGDSTRLPELSLLLFALAALLLLGRLIRLGLPPFESGALGALIASAAALHTVGQGASPTIFFTVAGLMLMVALVQDTYRMAFLDELTNLPARRALTMEMVNLRGRYTVAMADVDHFKKFNDTYGHDAGDQVLRMVAARLARVGGGGKTFRYGGEEFTILFSGKEADLAIPYLERLRASVADHPFVVRGPERRRKKPGKGRKRKPPRAGTKSVPVTISIGLAHRNATNATPEAVIKAADQALYRAKKAGRNRVAS